MPIIQRGFVIKLYLAALFLPLAALSLYAADNERKAELPITYEADVSFRDFPWGTSMDEVIKKMGKPVSREETNGLASLVWQDVDVLGYTTFMLCYFSPKGGLEGGTYYFVTHDQDEFISCYSEIQMELRDRFGPTILFDGIIRELRPYESSWDLPGGYVYLRANARLGEPVTLWYSSPELTKKVFGDTKLKPKPATTAKPAAPKPGTAKK
ncbi:MAG: hypothetical protein LBG95_00865 [Treponema sp.]|jgi:hypothetical protein|nr:hypothetical protein [Treponema sp.]